MTLNQLREKMRHLLGDKAFVSENHRTTYDEFFDLWPRYLAEGTTLDTPLTDEQMIDRISDLIESIQD